MSAITLKKIVLQHENAVIIDHLSEIFNSGEVYALIGASGSGKTSILKIMAGLILFQSGDVMVHGKNLSRFTQKQMLDYHRTSGFVFQNSALISNMSIYDNLALYYQYHTDYSSKKIDEQIKPLLEYFGFKDNLNSRPNVLSTGEKKIINIIRAISHNPDIIFWDNPLANLDAIVKKKVKNIIEKFKKEGKTMVLVTDDFTFGFSIADKIGVLNEGAIIENGTSDSIQNSKLIITQELISKE